MVWCACWSLNTHAPEHKRLHGGFYLGVGAGRITSTRKTSSPKTKLFLANLESNRVRFFEAGSVGPFLARVKKRGRPLAPYVYILVQNSMLHPYERFTVRETRKWFLWLPGLMTVDMFETPIRTSFAFLIGGQRSNRLITSIFRNCPPTFSKHIWTYKINNTLECRRRILGFYVFTKQGICQIIEQSSAEFSPNTLVSFLAKNRRNSKNIRLSV